MFNVYRFYRLSNVLYNCKVPVLPKLISYFVRLVYSAWIPGSAKIGKGTVLGYGALGIVIHNRAVIGKFCHIDQHVTVGGTSKKYDVPTIGDYVYIGAGAKILGPIKIGSNVVVGANSVVVKDVPDNSLVVGIPARVIKTGIYMKDYV